MTTRFSNSVKNGRVVSAHGRIGPFYRYGGCVLICLFMGNLSALIDAVLHSDIPYLDNEHLVVGGVTMYVTAILLLIVLRFITKMSQKEYELQALNAELERKVEERTMQLVETQEKLILDENLAMLGRITGNMGNELLNPLGVMNNAVYFLKMVLADADETTKEYLQIIKLEIDNSQQIITDLLDFARKKTPQIKAVTARRLIDESFDRCTVPENVELRKEVPLTLPSLKIDQLQMGQVLQKLIMNAVQAMPEGGELFVSARLVQSSGFKVQGYKEKNFEHGTSNIEPDADFIEISVADTGQGIAPENMVKLFQPLFTTKGRGIGMGLVFCKNRVEAIGGRIEVESEMGKGTTFALVLPIERGEA